ncbi:sensor histidine kinase [Bordetella muralis]|jgi:C4-dicarboxylate-specific signal transduction histidine kinase|uniref:sensor histidine kinase n=1 Tax=Bordetella muralis TaxID=1649130 RepID=UPI0039EF789D
MSSSRKRSSLRSPFILKLALIVVAMVAIFVVDTGTSYEVAAAVFYAVVIVTAAHVLSRRGLVVLCAICVGVTLLSVAITPHGDFRAGLINTGISIAAILMTTYLILKMEAARMAAHDAQAQLMRISRVKSLEGLTTSIAHEVNQPLAAIVASGNACQRWLAQTPPNLEKARSALERILNDAGRASSIIARVRSLTRGEPPHKREFEFNEAVLDVLALSNAEIVRNNIALTTELDPGLAYALADRIQIQQVIGNLVLNAVEAMAEISTQARVMRVSSVAKDHMIVLSVFDSGVGISPDVYEHMFEAFWTTKEEGIGVGLSISRAIIESNGGQLWAESNEHGGAVFRFSVPTILQEGRA